MKKLYLLFVIVFSFSTSLLSQTKKETIEKLERQVLELQENYVKVNTKAVILEEKLKFAEKEIRELKTEIFQIKSAQNSNTSKNPIIQNSEESNVQKVQPKENQPQSSGQCQATTKKGTRCSRKAQPGRGYCFQH
ncbi:MAG: DUF5763 domain-containing protein [Bacteroidota bacterium]|jgi:septal ring factor EnvC (AmiA/AmiB activator)